MQKLWPNKEEYKKYDVSLYNFIDEYNKQKEIINSLEQRIKNMEIVLNNIDVRLVKAGRKPIELYSTRKRLHILIPFARKI